MSNSLLYKAYLELCNYVKVFYASLYHKNAKVAFQRRYMTYCDYRWEPPKVTLYRWSLYRGL